MIPLSISTSAPKIDHNDENKIPNEELKSSTSDAVKESQIQVSFAEQTVSEMRQILSDWNSADSPEIKQRHGMRRNSLALMDVVQERAKRRILSVSSLVKGKIGVQSPTKTIETEMVDSESEISERSYVDDSLRVNDSFVCDEDDLPHISFHPSTDVLQQSTEVESIMRNTQKQTSELDRTFHATKYHPVMIELHESYKSLQKRTKQSNPKEKALHHRVEQADSSPTIHTNMANQSMQKIEMEKDNQGRGRQFFTYVLLPIALSILVAKVFVEYAEAEEELQ